MEVSVSCNRDTLYALRTLPDGVENEVIATIRKTFSLARSDAVQLFQVLMECMKHKDVVSWPPQVSKGVSTWSPDESSGSDCSFLDLPDYCVLCGFGGQSRH